MNCELSSEASMPIVDREIDVDAAGVIREHVATCAACRGGSPSARPSAGWCGQCPSIPRRCDCERSLSGLAHAPMKPAAVTDGDVGARGGGRPRASRGLLVRRSSTSAADRWRRSGQRTRAVPNGQSPVRCREHRPAHRQTVVPRQARFRAAGG